MPKVDGWGPSALEPLGSKGWGSWFDLIWLWVVLILGSRGLVRLLWVRP